MVSSRLKLPKNKEISHKKRKASSSAIDDLEDKQPPAKKLKTHQKNHEEDTTTTQIAKSTSPKLDTPISKLKLPTPKSTPPAPKVNPQSVKKKSKSREKSAERKNSSALYRCNLHPTIKWMEKNKHLISAHHIYVLKQTPFRKWFRIFYKSKLPIRKTIKKADTITKILGTFVSEDEGFKIGHHVILPKEEDLASCLHSQYKDLEKAMSLSLTQYRDDVTDFPRLWILHCLLTFFFVNGAETLSWKYLTYVIDFERVGEVSWPKSILKHLMSCVGNSSPGKCYGCVNFLMYWLCEHTEIISSSKKPRNMPKILSWDIGRFCKDLAKIDLQTYDKVYLVEARNEHERTLLDAEPKKIVFVQNEDGKTLVEDKNEDKVAAEEKRGGPIEDSDINKLTRGIGLEEILAEN